MAGELENYLEGAKHIYAGTDSVVYLSQSGNEVIKIYSNLRLTPGKSFSLDECFKMVERYNVDTLKAKEGVDFLWSKWMSSCGANDFILGGKKYKVNVKILPQGNINIIEGEIVSTGQEFVPGLTLKQIVDSGKVIEGYEELFHLDNRYSETYARIRKILATASYLMNIPNDIRFQIDNLNVKPIKDDEKGKLSFVVTDLASSIVGTYINGE